MEGLAIFLEMQRRLVKLLPWPGSPTYDNWLWFGESVALAAIALMAPLTVLLSKSNDEVLEDLRTAFQPLDA